MREQIADIIEEAAGADWDDDAWPGNYADRIRALFEVVAWGAFGRLKTPGRLFALQRAFLSPEGAQEFVDSHDPDVFEFHVIELYALKDPK